MVSFSRSWHGCRSIIWADEHDWEEIVKSLSKGNGKAWPLHCRRGVNRKRAKREWLLDALDDVQNFAYNLTTLQEFRHRMQHRVRSIQELLWQYTD